MVVFAYGVGAYVISLLAFLYSIGFVENWIVALTIDGSPRASGGGAEAWIGNIALLALFAAQHSYMARPAFKRAWTRLVPSPAERSTYVLVSSVLLMVLFGRWTPIPREVWDLGVHPLAFVLEMLSFAGWGLVIVAASQMNHLELLGLAQVLRHVRGEPPPPAKFRTPFLYRWVRHPVHLGFLVAFWSTPRMTLGHLLFAAAMTGYVLVAVRFEERDLAGVHGQYRAYQMRVPMLLPRLRPLPGRRRAG